MSATEGVSFSSKVGTAMQSAWQGTKHATTNYVIPACKYTADKVALAWDKSLPVVQKVFMTQAGLGGCFIVLSLCTLSLSLVIAQDNLKVALGVMALGAIILVAGMIFLSSAGVLPAIALLA